MAVARNATADGVTETWVLAHRSKVRHRWKTATRMLLRTTCWRTTRDGPEIELTTNHRVASLAP